MAKIHLFLNAKGGVGKSYIASIFAQYKIHQGQKPLCIDTDLVNATFSGYKALDVQQFDLGAIDEHGHCNFNHLMGRIPITHDPVIIDIGAQAFSAMLDYLGHNKAVELFAEAGHKLIIHTLITGGQSLISTIDSFLQLLTLRPDNALFVVWLNPHWGAIEDEGISFEHMNAYKENKDHITALIPIPPLNPATFDYDLARMLKDRLTFDEAISSPTRFIVTRQRLKMIRDGLYRQLNNTVVI